MTQHVFFKHNKVVYSMQKILKDYRHAARSQRQNIGFLADANQDAILSVTVFDSLTLLQLVFDSRRMF